MKRTLIAIVAAMFAAGTANAASILLEANNVLAVAGSVSTVTATLTIDPGGESVAQLSAYGVTVGWNNTVVRVVGSNGTTTFGKSTQSVILPGLSGSLTPGCASTGVNKGKACTVITQTRTLAGSVVVPGGSVVIGTLLLEHFAPLDPAGTSLGLIIVSSNNNGTTVPLTIDPSFSGAQVIPEPTTAALVGLGLLGLGFVGRRRV